MQAVVAVAYLPQEKDLHDQQAAQVVAVQVAMVITP
jgi:hypothetical protein